jgi:hypothetical protein
MFGFVLNPEVGLPALAGLRQPNPFPEQKPHILGFRNFDAGTTPQSGRKSLTGDVTKLAEYSSFHFFW